MDQKEQCASVGDRSSVVENMQMKHQASWKSGTDMEGRQTSLGQMSLDNRPHMMRPSFNHPDTWFLLVVAKSHQTRPKNVFELNVLSWIGQAREQVKRQALTGLTGYEWSKFAFCPRNPPRVRVMSSKPKMLYTTLLLLAYVIIVCILHMNRVIVLIVLHEIKLCTALH